MAKFTAASFLNSTSPVGSSGLDYQSLKSKYRDFSYPQAAIELNGEPFTTKDMVVNDINIELSSGFEASVARFRIYNVYDSNTGEFRYSEIKKSVILGVALTISLGYLDVMETVFVGFVAGVNFAFDGIGLPYVEVTGMDVKGIMMANCYAMQLTAHSYGEAVSEILERTAYEELSSAKAIIGLVVTDTPDKKSSSTSSQKAQTETIEMVSESDYEFIVKAAKKFNYEFFVNRGTVYFRKSKSDTSVLMKLGIGLGISKFDIGYSITGIVETIEARSMDPGTGEIITSKSKFNNTISTGMMANKLISKSRRVYIDPTINSKEQADARVESLMEQMSYRLGSLECECIGIPELLPGRFVEISGLGVPVDNKFYLTSVVHDFHGDSGYRTRLIGKVAEVKK